jgi:serine/threonine protein kinase
VALTLWLTKQVAVKVPNNLESLSEAQRRQILKKFQKEVNYAKRAQHPNVVKLIGLVHGDQSTSSQSFGIACELLQGGTLRDALDARGESMDMGLRQRWVGELFSGIGYLHEIGIIHRDIKSANVMLDGALRLKVCAFVAALGLPFAPQSSSLDSEMVRSATLGSPHTILTCCDRSPPLPQPRSVRTPCDAIAVVSHCASVYRPIRWRDGDRRVHGS